MARQKNTGRSANGSGTIRKRPDGLWEARYTVGFDVKTGKQKQRSVYGKTQAETRKKLNKALYEIDEGCYITPSKTSVSEWLTIWARDYINNVKPSTQKSYRDHIRLNISPYIGSVKLSNLTAPMVQNMYNELSAEKGLSPKTVKNVHGVLHKALVQAQKLGFIRNNPLDAVTLPRVEKKEIVPFEDDELARFLKEIKGNPYERVYEVTVFTGMRQGEVLGLTWDCVDFEKNTLYINKQHGKIKGTNQYAFSSLKNDKPRTITAANGVMDVLRKQLEWQRQWAKKLGCGWDNPDNLVFTTETGRYLCNQTVYLAYKKVVKKLGMDYMRFHDLRHTFAVDCLKSGDDIKTVQENLGHHTAAFTLSTYAHANAGMRKESAERMDNFMKSVIK